MTSKPITRVEFQRQLTCEWNKAALEALYNRKRAGKTILCKGCGQSHSSVYNCMRNVKAEDRIK
jgi:hypothetical protein